MKQHELRLARPIYEGLPWAYACAGVAALAESYLQSSPRLSLFFGLPGLAALLGGIVIILRRRQYRRMRTQYERPDALAERGREAGQP